jgi:hypothetical protein
MKARDLIYDLAEEESGQRIMSNAMRIGSWSCRDASKAAHR